MTWSLEIAHNSGRICGRELYPPPERPNHEPSLSDDASLIAATLAGDTAAFGRLVEQYQDRLYNSLLRVLGSAEDAADIVQDAFVQAYVKLRYVPRRRPHFTLGCIASHLTWP